MTILTDEEVAEFQQLAREDGQILTEEEARVVALRIALLYERLAEPTPEERQQPVRSRSAEAKARAWTEPENREVILILKRGNGREHNSAFTV